MSLYVDDKGGRYEIPSDPTPKEVAEIRQLGLRPEGMGPGEHMAHDLTRSSGAGASEGLFRGPLIGGDLYKLALTGINKVVPEAFDQADIERYGSQGWIDAFRGSPQDKFLKDKLGLDVLREPETAAGRYAKAGTSATAGAASLGSIGALPNALKMIPALRGMAGAAPAAQGLTAAAINTSPGAITANAAGGIAGEAGYDLSRGFDETKPGNPIAGLAAGLGVGGVANAVRLARAPNLDQQLFNATKSMDKNDWSQTMKDLVDYLKSGSKTTTLADLPKLQPRIGGLAQDLSNATGGDLLRQRLSTQARTAGKDSDIPQLLKSVTEGIPAGPVDPREVARLMSAKGASAIANAPGPRTAATLQDSLAGGVAGTRDFSQTLAALRRVPPEKLQRELYMMGLSDHEALQLGKAVAGGLKPVPNVTKAPELMKDRDALEQILDYVNPNLKNQANNKLNVTDSLSRLSAEHGADRTTQMELQKNWMQIAASPFSTIARRSGLRTGEKETEKIAAMFGNPTKENLAELERLSKIDPRILRRLQTASSLAGIAESQGSDRSGK